MSDNDNVVPLNAIDPSKFRIPASDARGHNVRRSLRIQPVLWMAISTLVNSKYFPYKDNSEFIRHAIVRHIRWLESIGEVPSVSGQVEAANAILSQDQINEEFQETFISLRNRITDYRGRGHLQEARKLVSQMRASFDRMPDGYWKDQYKRQLEEYDSLFENVPTIGLTQFAK